MKTTFLVDIFKWEIRERLKKITERFGRASKNYLVNLVDTIQTMI